MQANDKRYSDRSNKNDLREDFCDWSELFAHSTNSAQSEDIGRHISTERNQQNNTTTNHERSAEKQHEI